MFRPHSQTGFMQPADRKFPKAGKQVFDSIEISMQRQTGMRLLVVNCIVLLFSNLPAQPLTLSLDEMFRLADQHSKSIRLHDLAIREAEQGVRIAKMTGFFHPGTVGV